MRIKEFAYCARCNTDINWHIDNIADHEYDGAIDKLLHHQEGAQCKREVMIKELLDDEDGQYQRELTKYVERTLKTAVRRIDRKEKINRCIIK
jgi:hypothetical protein